MGKGGGERDIYFEVYSYRCGGGLGIELVVAVSYEYWRRVSASGMRAIDS